MGEHSDHGYIVITTWSGLPMLILGTSPTDHTPRNYLVLLTRWKTLELALP